VSEPPPTRSFSDRAGSREQIGPYALITQMATGPVGARWAAQISEGVETGRLVSVRRVQVADGKSRATHWLYDSGKRAQAIRHPRVAALLDVVRGSGELAVVSEFVEGETLNSLLRLAALESVPIPPSVALGIIRDLCEALDAAQSRWRELTKSKSDPLRLAVHGGVTPDVVLVASFGEALLVDAGLAGAAARLPRILKHPSALPYRAPEQLKRTSPVDERSDVFSLGVLLWEMLANRPLFGPADRLRHPESETMAAADVRSLEDEILGKPIPRLDELPRVGAPIRSSVVKLAARALERAPTDRFLTLKGMSEALRALPSDAVAGSEQVAVSVDRLARPLITSRRNAIEMATHARVMESVAPSSGRPTAKPEAPEKPVTVLVPRTALPAPGLANLAKGFGETEAPTMRRGLRTPRDGVAPEAPTRPAVKPAAGRSPRPYLGFRKITVPGLGAESGSDAGKPSPATAPKPAAGDAALAAEAEPVSVEPISLEAVSIEPASAEPVSVEPVSVEPASENSASVDPEPASDTGVDEACAIFGLAGLSNAEAVGGQPDPAALRAPALSEAVDLPEGSSLVAVETEKPSKRGWAPVAAALVILTVVVIVVGLRLVDRSKPNALEEPAPPVSPTEARQESDESPAPPSDTASSASQLAPTDSAPATSAPPAVETHEPSSARLAPAGPTPQPRPPSDLKRLPPSQATPPAGQSEEAPPSGSKAFRPSGI